MLLVLQPTLLVLSISEDNNYPQYVKLRQLPNYKGESNKNYLKDKCIFDPSTIINCDRDKAFFRLSKIATLENSVIDYSDVNHKLRWLNTFARNIKVNIQHIYRLVKKRDIPLSLAEQEWRINHRKTGRNVMNKVVDYLRKSYPITH